MRLNGKIRVNVDSKVFVFQQLEKHNWHFLKKNLGGKFGGMEKKISNSFKPIKFEMLIRY